MPKFITGWKALEAEVLNCGDSGWNSTFWVE